MSTCFNTNPFTENIKKCCAQCKKLPLNINLQKIVLRLLVVSNIATLIVKIIWDWLLLLFIVVSYMMWNKRDKMGFLDMNRIWYQHWHFLVSLHLFPFYPSLSLYIYIWLGFFACAWKQWNFYDWFITRRQHNRAAVFIQIIFLVTLLYLIFWW